MGGKRGKEEKGEGRRTRTRSSTLSKNASGSLTTSPFSPRSRSMSSWVRARSARWEAMKASRADSLELFGWRSQWQFFLVA
jgi:hypothetical protein